MAEAMTIDRKRLRELALAATPGPWCYESCGEKGDGANIIGVAFGPDDERCERPLSGRLEEWTEDGKEIEYYRDEEVATCEHSNRNAGRNAAFIAAANPQTIRALLDALEAAEQRAPDDALDMARYRWLRDKCSRIEPASREGPSFALIRFSWDYDCWPTQPDISRCDDAIDRAIAEQAKEQK